MHSFLKQATPVARCGQKGGKGARIAGGGAVAGARRKKNKGGGGGTIDRALHRGKGQRGGE